MGTAIVAFLVFLCLSLQAQDVTDASGGNATGSGGTVSYSVGQVVYTTHTGSSGTVAQGVQQPYEISVVTGIKDYANINISMSAFPNPTADNLTLEVKDYKIEKMSYQLFDMQGKLLEITPMFASQTQINMGNLPSATYLIHVIQENLPLKSFKIIKN